MILHTRFFGEMELDKGKLISFSKGLPGFDDLKEFAIINLPDESPFYCLQSTKQSEIAFLIINPWDFFIDYDINIPEDDLADIGIEKLEQLLIYNIVTVPEDMEKISANLLGPIVINKESLKGKQVILNNNEYGTKHLLFDQREVV